MIARALTITREMIPSVDLVVKAAIRVTVGAGLILIAARVPDAVAKWISFGGHLFVMLAAISIFSHAEQAFTKHAAAKLRVIWDALSLRALAIIGLATVSLRQEHEDEHGMG